MEVGHFGAIPVVDNNCLYIFSILIILPDSVVNVNETVLTCPMTDGFHVFVMRLPGGGVTQHSQLSRHSEGFGKTFSQILTSVIGTRQDTRSCSCQWVLTTPGPNIHVTLNFLM